MQKKIFRLECDCGREIVGFSMHHARVNLEIHQHTSKFHKEVMLLLKKYEKKK